MVAESGAKNARLIFAILIGPSDNGVVDTVFIARVLLAACEDFGGGPCGEVAFGALDVIVELFFHGRPVRETLGDGVLGIGKSHLDGLEGAVTGGLQTEEVEPFCLGGIWCHRSFKVATAVGMHGAMEIDSRHAIRVSVDDVVNGGGVFDIGSALVVDDNIVCFGPIRIGKNRENRLGVAGFIVVHHDFTVYAGFDSFFENQLLLIVFMATATDHEKNFQWLHLGMSKGTKANEGNGGNGLTQHDSDTVKSVRFCQKKLSPRIPEAEKGGYDTMGRITALL